MMDTDTLEPSRDDYTLFPTCITLPKNKWSFQIILEKSKFYNSADNTLSFANLKKNHTHDATLFLFLYYLTFCFNGMVYQIALESKVGLSAMAKSLPVRDGASKYYVFVFVLPWPTENISVETHDNWLENECESDDVGFDDGPGGEDGADMTGAPQPLKTHVYRAFMRLLSYKLNVVSYAYLYVRRYDIMKQLDKIFEVLNAQQDSVAQCITRKVVTIHGGQLFNSRKVAHDGLIDKFSLRSLLTALSRYTGEPLVSTDLDPEHIWDQMSELMKVYTTETFQVYCTEITKSMARKLRSFFRAFNSQETEKVETKSMIVFQYNWGDIMTESDLLKCFSVCLHRCYTVPSQSVNLRTYTCDVCTGEQMCIHKYAKFYANYSGSINALIAGNTDPFTVIYPHMHTIHMVIKEALKDKHTMLPKDTRSTYVRWMFYSLMNCYFQSTPNVTAIYTTMSNFIQERALSLTGSFAVDDGSNELWMGSVNPKSCWEHPAKVYDKTIVEKLFGTFKITRFYQAYISLSYIISNSAPRQHTQKFMIVNFTGPAEGKTFANDVLKALFTIPEYLEDLGSFTPRAFVHNKRIRTCSVITVEDVANAPEKLQNCSAESSPTSNTFKQILDSGVLYTDSTVTNKTKTAMTHETVRVCSVQNAGFIWSTNTLELMSNAWLDRSLILGSEYGPLIRRSMSSSTIQHQVKAKKLNVLCKTMLYRQNLAQTAIVMCDSQCLHITKKNMTVVETIMSAFSKRFPLLATSDRPANRNAVKLDYLIFMEGMKQACNIAFDLWIPPWTVLPSMTGVSDHRTYMKLLNAARFRALSLVPLDRLTIDVLVFYKLMYPTVLIDHAPKVLGIDVASKVLRAVANIIRSVVTSSETRVPTMAHSRGAMVFTNFVGCNLSNVMKMPWLQDSSVKQLMRNITKCFVTKRSGRLENYGYYKEKMVISTDNVYDTYMTVFPDVGSSLWNKLKAAALRVYRHAGKISEDSDDNGEAGGEERGPTEGVMRRGTVRYIRMYVNNLSAEEQFLLTCLAELPQKCRMQELEINSMTGSAKMLIETCYGALLLQSSLEGAVAFKRDFYCVDSVVEAYGWCVGSKKRCSDGLIKLGIPSSIPNANKLKLLKDKVPYIHLESFHKPRWLAYTLQHYVGPCVKNAVSFCKTLTVFDGDTVKLKPLCENNTRSFAVPKNWEYDAAFRVLDQRTNNECSKEVRMQVYSYMLFRPRSWAEIKLFIDSFTSTHMSMEKHYGDRRLRPSTEDE